MWVGFSWCDQNRASVNNILVSGNKLETKDEGVSFTDTPADNASGCCQPWEERHTGNDAIIRQAAGAGFVFIAATRKKEGGVSQLQWQGRLQREKDSRTRGVASICLSPNATLAWLQCRQQGANSLRAHSRLFPALLLSFVSHSQSVSVASEKREHRVCSVVMADKKSKAKRQKKGAAAVEASAAEATTKAGKNQQRTLSRMNPNQKEAIIAFMEGHAEVLSAAVSRLHPRELVEALWGQLTVQLNELGHVPKTTNTWKKTWFDLRREVKAKLGPPPYGAQYMTLPGDMSATGQRGRIAALMTRAVRICQQHAAASLQGALKHGESGGERGDSTEEEPPANEDNPLSPPVVEMSVKCEPPDFAGFDLDELRAIQQQQQRQQQRNEPANSHTDDEAAPTPEKKSRRGSEDFSFSSMLQMLAASQERVAMAMEGLSSAATGLGEVFRHRNAIEAEKAEALKQIAEALRFKPAF
ncbi:hypothetical protein B566_EDAN013762 [Ephemera danica]|nr:hypothetical protein B566_EDAN013762 [Ephemera danica]